jgi:acyl carrier protein
VNTLEDATLAVELATFIDEQVSSGGEPVLPDTDLVMTGLVDSLGVVLIVEWLEQRLSIEIDPSDVVIEHFISVTAMIDYLR